VIIGRKISVLEGKEYISTKGKVVPEKMCKPCICSHGRQHVFKRHLFSSDCRKNLISEYYRSADFGRQRDFILNHTMSVATTNGKRKHRALQDSLPLAGSKIRVCKKKCKKRFLSTIDVSEKLVTYTLTNCTRVSGSMVFSKADMRGKHTPANKTPELLLDGVRNHINSFPKMEPHYTRADTNRHFLGSDLSIKKMHELYLEQCKVNDVPSVKEGVYHRVFCDEFNLSFHVPKKDACAKCEQYENTDDKLAMDEEHLLHVARKKAAQDEKKTADKKKSLRNF